MDSSISYYFTVLTGQLPGLLVGILGLVLALVNLRSHPVPSRWVLIASLVWIGTAIAQPILQVVQMNAYRSGGAAGGASMVFSVLHFLFALLRAGAMAGILFAVYAGRRETRGLDHSPRP